MQYAVRIYKSDLPLLAMLNGGVEPEVGNGKNYLVIDTDPDVPNEIWKERDLFSTREIYEIGGAIFFKLKKQK